MTETEWQEFKNDYNKKRREKYHSKSIKKSVFKSILVQEAMMTK